MLFWAEEVILLVLGAQWTGAVQLFLIIGIAGFTQPLANTTGWLFVATGRTDRMLRWRIATVWVGPTLYVIGVLTYGVVGVAVGHAIASLSLTLPCVWYAQRGTGIGIRGPLLAAARPILAAVGANAIVYFLLRERAHFLLALPAAVPVYLTLLCVASWGLGPLREIKEIIAIALGRREE
jgi:PST family polysaccharide transporter